MAKYRLDFVTNSSSSSYVCDICGGDESGWDLCLSDADMIQCVNGHTLHESCGNGMPDAKEVLLACINKQIAYYTESTYYTPDAKAERILEQVTLLNRVNADEIDEDSMMDMAYDKYDLRSEMPSSVCPICSFGVAQDSDIASYLLNMSGTTKEKVLLDMKEKFGTYEVFCKFIQDKMNEVESED